MAVLDDLKTLAALDVVYLTSVLTPPGTQGVITVYQGRLHQAIDGNWIFNTSTGNFGVVAQILGDPTQQGASGVISTWTSSDGPGSGLVVTIIFQFPGGALNQVVTLKSVIPPELTE